MSQIGRGTNRSRASLSRAGQSITAGVYGSNVSSRVRQKSVLCASLPRRIGPSAKAASAPEDGLNVDGKFTDYHAPKLLRTNSSIPQGWRRRFASGYDPLMDEFHDNRMPSASVSADRACL